MGRGQVELDEQEKKNINSTQMLRIYSMLVAYLNYIYVFVNSRC